MNKIQRNTQMVVTGTAPIRDTVKGRVDNSRPGQPVFWPQFIYFSLVTLTTSGYGDILPVSGWARALSNVEQVMGVLTIAVLMARLVGLYSEERRDK